MQGYLNKDMPPIDEDSYNMFVNNLSQLTTKERAIFDLYLAGPRAQGGHCQARYYWKHNQIP